MSEDTNRTPVSSETSETSRTPEASQTPEASRNPETSQTPEKPRRKRWGLRIFLTLVVIMLCAVIGVAAAAYSYFHSKYTQIYVETPDTGAAQTTAVQEEEASGGGEDESDYEAIVEPNPDFAWIMEQAVADLEVTEAVEATGEIPQTEEVFNVLLIGTDERTDGRYSDNARGDACMLLSINFSGESPMFSLVSFERGMGVPILEGSYAGQWDWLTHTFRYGGADLLMKEVNECFNLDIEYYVRLNFDFFIDCIELLGGVDVYLDDDEYSYLKDNPLYPGISVGTNHLNGEQALGYARLRALDSDWVRIQRQREIVLSAFNQCRTRTFEELDALVDLLLPMVQTNIPESRIGELLLELPRLRYAETQQMTIPVKGTYGGMTGMGGRSLYAVDFEVNAQILKEFLYPQLLEEEAASGDETVSE